MKQSDKTSDLLEVEAKMVEQATEVPDEVIQDLAKLLLPEIRKTGKGITNDKKV